MKKSWVAKVDKKLTPKKFKKVEKKGSKIVAKKGSKIVAKIGPKILPKSVTKFDQNTCLDFFEKRVHGFTKFMKSLG
jgi:hypothetical protein